MTQPVTILIVEDDEAIRCGLADACAAWGHQSAQCVRGDEVAGAIETHAPDLILLDVMLPGCDGFAVLDALDPATRPPVIMLTALGSEADRVRGLGSGADDYVLKPFSIRELMARVDAVLRRTRRAADGDGASNGPITPTSISCGVCRIDLERGDVLIDENTCDAARLSPRECDILRLLAAHHGHPVSRDDLLREAWSLDPRGIRTRTVDMHVMRLRRKLTDAGAPEVVETLRGRGYVLVDHASVSPA